MKNNDFLKDFDKQDRTNGYKLYLKLVFNEAYRLCV